MEGSIFREVALAEQKPNDGVVFPAVLVPNNDSNPTCNRLHNFTEAIREHKPWLESLLHKTGAILFRGFHVTSPSEFNDVVEAFGFDEHLYTGGIALRNNVTGRVFTANESPPDKLIPFHHEMAQLPESPSKLFFFCEVEPGKGGETPIVLSHIVYDKMKERYPDFVDRLEEHGLIYTRVLGDDDDPSSAIGRGWVSTFFTKDKNVAEERAAKMATRLEWIEDGVRTIMGPVPGIKFDKARQRKVWFNGMVAAYIGWKDSRNDPVKAVKFGDGTPLPAHVILDCMKIMDEASVSIAWKSGDVLLLDNLAVLHARRSFDLPRRILTSLCK